MMEIGSLLRTEREERGFSMRGLARASGISPTYMSDIEHGKRRPSVRVITSLSSLLDLDFGRLLILAGKACPQCGFRDDDRAPAVSARLQNQKLRADSCEAIQPAVRPPRRRGDG